MFLNLSRALMGFNELRLSILFVKIGQVWGLTMRRGEIVFILLVTGTLLLAQGIPATARGEDQKEMTPQEQRVMKWRIIIPWISDVHFRHLPRPVELSDQIRIETGEISGQIQFLVALDHLIAQPLTYAGLPGAPSASEIRTKAPAKIRMRRSVVMCAP